MWGEAWRGCGAGQMHLRTVVVQRGNGLPGGQHTWASFLPTAYWDGVLALHSPCGAETCLHPPSMIIYDLWSVAGKLPWGTTTDIVKVSLEKKKDAKLWPWTSASPAGFLLTYFSFSFINNTVGVWGAHCLSCIQFNGSYMLAAEKEIF